MPDKSMQRVMAGVDTAAKQLKGPYDRIDELKSLKTDLEKRITAGQSGDGLKKPDLKAQLTAVNGDLENLLRSNPEKR